MAVVMGVLPHGFMRRILTFAFGAALFGAGGYLLFLEVRCAVGMTEGACRYGGKLALSAALPLVLGCWLLWESLFKKWTAGGVQD
jgi:hypothetical protein